MAQLMSKGNCRQTKVIWDQFWEDGVFGRLGLGPKFLKEVSNHYDYKREEDVEMSLEKL